ncbi:hypothetical protein PQ472_11100 [Lacticaseibacillus pabuli]|uniref:HicB-like antitoxin of toxin-antitoxin system domain-containing protein n=1 Tax=Lacticaseibacillus pabuli TaxID=3025672 RepID=A0ABY7WQF5_9LACO|nr:hypothetical protein [Lacticaseibacillus sp. KACC 23028]WDF82423.1 hypothetical protein PQ472_11100 [Lacticaseibacillus sp. KACC 23028]
MANPVAYPAIINDAPGRPDAFTVSFPDVPTAAAEGVGLGQVILNGSQVLGLALADMDPDSLPVPSEQTVIEEANPDAIVSYIAVDLDAAREVEHVTGAEA